MIQSAPNMAEQIAQAATAFQQHLTGHEPKSVSVVVGGDTLVVTLHGALSVAERTMAQTLKGADKVREFHRQLFLNASDMLRQEIKRITRMDVREETAEVFCTSGIIVQVFVLSGKVPSESFNAGNIT
jgi:uncharacterized protein YbcI